MQMTWSQIPSNCIDKTPNLSWEILFQESDINNVRRCGALHFTSVCKIHGTFSEEFVNVDWWFMTNSTDSGSGNWQALLLSSQTTIKVSRTTFNVLKKTTQLICSCSSSYLSFVGLFFLSLCSPMSIRRWLIDCWFLTALSNVELIRVLPTDVPCKYKSSSPCYVPLSWDCNPKQQFLFCKVVLFLSLFTHEHRKVTHRLMIFDCSILRESYARVSSYRRPLQIWKCVPLLPSTFLRLQPQTALIDHGVTGPSQLHFCTCIVASFRTHLRV